MSEPAPRKVGRSRSGIGNAGKGRKKGVPNKATRELKEMILQALEGAGGVDYLIKQAEASPSAFLALIGKVLPMQVNAEVDANIRGRLVWEWPET